MNLHKLLQRQLNRTELNADSAPKELENWQSFLNKVSQTYQDADQDRYLIRRSMDLSSREMGEINKKLELAQEITGVGYFFYDFEVEERSWSKEIYKMFNIEIGQPVPDFNFFINMVKEEERESFRQLITNAMQNSESYETENRLHTNSDQNESRWFHIKGTFFKNNQGKVAQLSGLMIDITHKKNAETELENLNNQLIDSARHAGMAQVATTILHNVGNILNSANVSASLVQEKLEGAHLTKLQKIAEMIAKNKDSLDVYFTQDEKGKLLPEYIVGLSQKLNDLHTVIKSEMKILHEQLNHIKDITNLQQHLSGVSEIVEKLSIEETINTALQMIDKSIESKKITVKQNIDEDIFIFTNKSKLLQILINLIQNSIDAVTINNNLHKNIVITANMHKNNISIEIADNGVGITKEELPHIFTFGFTTKKEGHGFGLHSSAIAAKELHGKLEVESKGMNHGAKFILTLPLALQNRGSDNERKIKSTHYSY